MISRRNFIRSSASGLLILPYLDLIPKAAASPFTKPRFFLQVFLRDGADNTYFFDGRPLAMTQAGVLQNYIGKEPTPWVGLNGGVALATELMKPLEKYKNELTILNGIVMEASSNGHEQNINCLLTGNPFGGESFIPHLNYVGSGDLRPLDCLMSGGIFGTNFSNFSKTVEIDPSSSASLGSRLVDLPTLDTQDELESFILSRMSANAQGMGRFSAGSRQLAGAMNDTANLHQKMVKLPPLESSLAPELKFIELAANYFRAGLSRSAMYLPRLSIDAHDTTTAQSQPATFGIFASDFAAILDYLKATPFDDKNSMFDVTTIMFCSEFSRTMRQKDAPSIDKTGTDHNPLTNSIWFAGAGIKGGNVFGASNRSTATEAISNAQKLFDPENLMIMGRPFDFVSEKPRMDLPETYNVGDYLSIHSVVNTIYASFGVSQEHYRLLGRSLPAAPILKGLIS